MNYYEQISSTMKLLDDLRDGNDINDIYEYEELEQICGFINDLVDKNIEEYAENIRNELQTTPEKGMEITREKIDEAIIREYNLKDFFITDEQVKSLKPFKEPENISRICEYINEATKENDCCRVHYKDICEWLIEIGYLDVAEGAKVSSKKHITKLGFEKGLSYELKEKNGQHYKLIVYDASAQQFIFNNLQNLNVRITIPKEKKKESKEIRENAMNAGAYWDDEQEKLLLKYYLEDNLRIFEIAKLMKRTRGAIASRLRKMEREGKL